MVTELLVDFHFILVTRLDLADHLHLLLQEDSEIRPVVVKLLQVQLHVFLLLLLYALQIVLPNLSVDVKHFVELTTLALSFLADSLALVHKVLVHLGWVDMLFKTTARDTTILPAVLAAMKASSSDATTSCILALELTFFHTILNLAVNNAHSTS